jgi:GntR family transcriptional repressor for pyruvate dehydrogenase complex
MPQSILESIMPANPKFNIERITTPGTLADRVFKALIDLMDENDLAPGSRLPSEMNMASRFGVSRTVIREAVSRLKSEGLVESRQGSGVFVREKSTDSPFRLKHEHTDSTQSILQVIELRQALEGEIAALAAQRGTRKQLAAIKQALEKIDADVVAGGDGVNADLQFHHIIAETTGNPHFLALNEFLTESLRVATRALRSYEASQVDLAQQVRDEHLAIVDALILQDPDAARTAARKHMEGAARRMHSAGKRKSAQEKKHAPPTTAA